MCLTLISLPLYDTITETNSHTIVVGERRTDDMTNVPMMTLCVQFAGILFVLALFIKNEKLSHIVYLFLSTIHMYENVMV